MEKRENQSVEMEKSRKRNRILAFCFILFSVYFVYTFLDQQTQINKYNSQIEVYKTEIAAKNEITNYYKEQAENTTTDKYIEQVARETLGYVKPYEKVFVDTNK